MGFFFNCLFGYWLCFIGYVLLLLASHIDDNFFKLPACLLFLLSGVPALGHAFNSSTACFIYISELHNVT